MKILKYIFILVSLIFITSCEDYFGSESNIDPDNPTTVTPNVLLPQVQARLVYTYGGDFARYIGLYTQHVDGISRQFAVLGQYGISPSDTDTPWSNIYTGTLNSNRQLLLTSRAGGFNHYTGIALALESYSMLISTDLWGDIPYSDAFRFAENGVYTPTFDTQQDVYNQILTNLSEARTLLSTQGGGNVPGNDDLIYRGDVSKWIKFTNVLEARAQLHLSKVNSDAYAKVLSALSGGEFEHSGDNAGFAFGNPATENAPWYQYIEQRDDCEVGATYVALLQSFDDPRLATYGQPHTNNHPIWTRDQTVNLLSFTEQEFIKAEALLSSDRSAAYEAYLSGISSSLMEALVDDAGYDSYLENASVAVGADNLTLENIITQKYLALYTDPEVFSDWRRTNFPALIPVTGTAIPRRIPYAQTEILSNPNTPSQAEVGIFNPVWWDQ